MEYVQGQDLSKLMNAALRARREVPLEPDSWSLFSSAGLDPSAELEQSERTWCAFR